MSKPVPKRTLRSYRFTDAKASKTPGVDEVVQPSNWSGRQFLNREWKVRDERVSLSVFDNLSKEKKEKKILGKALSCPYDPISLKVEKRVGLKKWKSRDWA